MNLWRDYFFWGSREDLDLKNESAKQMSEANSVRPECQDCGRCPPEKAVDGGRETKLVVTLAPILRHFL